MPHYQFRITGSNEARFAQLVNDDAAWSEMVVLCGEVLKEVDGGLRAGSEWGVTVFEGVRRVSTIRLTAHRCAAT